MKVVLRQPVDGLGKRGDIIDVSVGHARNYLIPHALAIPATAGIEAQAESMRRSRMLRDAKDREAAEEIAKHLVSKTISITARAGEGDRLFGSVSMSDIAAAINDQAGVDIDRRKLEIADAIKELGQYQVTVRLHSDVQFPVTVEVIRGHESRPAPRLCVDGQDSPSKSACDVAKRMCASTGFRKFPHAVRLGCA